MFGALRFLLASLVVVSHLVGGDYLAHFGFYAVRGFFVLSGFLMTSALNAVYGFDGVRFWLNRALRLLPPYLLACAVTLAAISALPAQAALFLKFWSHLPRLNDVFLNVALMPLQFPEPAYRLIPPAWSLAVEIDMYLLLYLAVARRLGFAVVALIAGLSYQLAVGDMAWGGIYFTAPAALVPFSAGALIYFLRAYKPDLVNGYGAAVAVAAWLFNLAAGGFLLPASYVFGVGYYVDTVLFAGVVAGLAGCRWRPLLARLDVALGECAYPIFLAQWFVGFLVAVVLADGQWRGWKLLLAASLPLVLVGAGFAALNRWMIEPVRDRLRARPRLRSLHEPAHRAQHPPAFTVPRVIA